MLIDGQKLTCFLPCRKGSERVPDKNIRTFGKYEFGLFERKLEQLKQVEHLDKIIISTDCPIIQRLVEKESDLRIILDIRDESLCSSATLTDELIDYVPSLVPEGSVLWTHVTSPFFDAEMYNLIIKEFTRKISDGYDSLMTARELRAFFWMDGRSINYDRSVEKWPRTQTLEPILEIDSAAFIAPIDIYKAHNDRIGERPWIFKNTGKASFDIDWQVDFDRAVELLNG